MREIAMKCGAIRCDCRSAHQCGTTRPLELSFKIHCIYWIIHSFVRCSAMASKLLNSRRDPNPGKSRKRCFEVAKRCKTKRECRVIPAEVSEAMIGWHGSGK